MPATHTKPKDLDAGAWANYAQQRYEERLNEYRYLKTVDKAMFEAAKAEAKAANRLYDLLATHPRQLRQVNEALRLLGEPEVELAKGHNYYYFRCGDAHTWNTASVMVFALDRLTVADWVHEFENLSGRKLL